MRPIHRRSQILLLFLAALTITSTGIPQSHAAGEIYALTVSPGRIQEANLPGVTLTLNVTNAAVSTNYRFTWVVQDPTGASRNVVNSTTTASNQTSFILSVIYPRSFPAGTSPNYVGTYTVTINQNQPMPKPGVASGQFQVGLTDSLAYERTFRVSTLGQGYAISENVTVDISHDGTPAPNFPASNITDAKGDFSYTWHVPANVSTGTYTVTLAGARTTKNPADTQTFTIYPTNVTITQLTVTSSALQRSLAQGFLFSPIYPDGTPVRTGQASVRIIEADSVTAHNAVAVYDSTAGMFRATYRIPLNGQTGIWVATIDPDTMDDGYGNGGPQATVAKGFQVQTAVLAVSVSINNQTYNEGGVIPVYATIMNPDGTLYTAGSARATFWFQARQVGSPIALMYVSGQGKWVGSYQIGANQPAGVWIVNVTASDSSGNSGQGTSSAVISTPPPSNPAQQSFLNSQSFLILAIALAIIAAALVLWATFWSHRKLAQKQVKLDLKLIDNEVGRIEGADFFQNVKRQVEEKKSEGTAHPSESSKGDSPNK